jgi:hypothetical protein
MISLTKQNLLNFGAFEIPELWGKNHGSKLPDETEMITTKSWLI